jgi:hypothetical protein
MYPIEIFLMVVAIDGLLSAYATISKGTDYYKDVVALGFACFLSVYLALVSIAGTAIDCAGNPIMDDGLMWIFIIIAVIQGIFVMMELIEAYEEHLHNKATGRNPPL